MRVCYADVTLRLLVFDPAYRSVEWSASVVMAVRRRHQTLVAAGGRSEVEALRSLEFRVHASGVGERCSIKLADGERLLLDFDLTMADCVSVVEIMSSEARKAVR